MHTWITDRPKKRRRRTPEAEMPRLHLPLPIPMEHKPEQDDTANDDTAPEPCPRGVTEVDFYI